MTEAFMNCIILDGTENMEPIRGKNIIVENGKITSIGSSAPGDCKKYNLNGAYIIPGLINAHVHLPGNGVPKDTGKQNKQSVDFLMSNAVTRFAVKQYCKNYAKTELLSGVTTIRTVGGLGSIDSSIRDDINAGKADGPRILASNMAVSVPGGHMAGVLAYEATTADEARGFVRKISLDNPDLIKIMVTGGVLDATVKGEPGVLKMPPELIFACCDEAHKLGYKVAAHCESLQGVKAALKGGVDTVEHGAALDDEAVKLFQKTGAADICTISPAIPLAHMGTEVPDSTELTVYNGNIVFEGIVSCAKSALEAGVPVGLGTDTACPFVTHYDMWREVVYFHKYVGVSNRFALYSATLGNARILGVDNVTGSIEVGKDADFLVVDGNPIKDLRNLRTPKMVVARGKVYKNQPPKKVDYIENVLERELDTKKAFMD